MKVILANPRGFCAGVNMAIDSLATALELYGPPVYVFHEIVHNKHVVSQFRERGAIFVDSIDEIPEGANVLYSAHGVSPEIRAVAHSRELHAIDATCPLVTKVHTEAIRFARKDYTIYLIGHEGHDEIAGTIGEAPCHMHLVETADGVGTLPEPHGAGAAFLTQTTLSIDDANAIIARLRERFPTIVAPPSEDICYATQNRQEAVRELASEADVVLVLGSQNSSNSQRLAEIAREMGKPAHLVDRAGEIDPAWLAGAGCVFVTAGASAPEELVQECVAYLRQRFGAEVEERVVRVEDMQFQLPVELRRALAGAGERSGVPNTQ